MLSAAAWAASAAVFAVSAATRAGLRDLTLRIGQMVGADRAERLAAEESLLQHNEKCHLLGFNRILSGR